MVERGTLSACRADESASLWRLIRQAIATSASTGFGPGGATSISRRAGPSLQVLVTPVRNLPLDLEKRVAAVVFVSDPLMKTRPAREILVGLFGLTPAECRVATLLTDGHAPRQIGQLLGVSNNTLKSQLASIYSKTGTSRQSQVVRLISRLPLQAPEQGRV
jgi:DNA-binding CsgD family transcriptional regulator